MSQIFWKDFVLDDVFGPLLAFPETSASCRTEAQAGCTDTQEGIRAKIQETRTEQRPARMVGLSDLDSSAQVDREVGRRIPAYTSQAVWQGEGA